MKLDDYIEQICSGNIPEEAPEFDSDLWRQLRAGPGKFLEQYYARDACKSRGMWCIVEKTWLKELADWIGNRKVLEVMCGGGYIAKGLKEFGVDIIATDNFSWKEVHHKMVPVFPVKKVPAITSISKHKADILLVSWPPYNDKIIEKIGYYWANKYSRRPIIYIGEGPGGCTATDKFWNNFNLISNAPNIKLKQWDGIHDNIYIGYYNKNCL